MSKTPFYGSVYVLSSKLMKSFGQTKHNGSRWTPPIKKANSFLIIPGVDGVIQSRVPCTTCPTPCRNFDFQNWKDCKNTYCQPTVLSTFESTEMAIQKQNQYFEETLYTPACKKIFTLSLKEFNTCFS